MKETAQNPTNRILRKNSLWILAQKLITPLITFLISVVIVRVLSVEAFGVYNILFAIMGYVGLVSSLGLIHILKRYIPEFMQKGEASHVLKTVRFGLLTRAVLAVLCSMLLLALSGPMGRLFKIEALSSYAVFLTLGVLFFLEAQLLGVALVSLFMHPLFVIAQIGYTLFRGALVVALLKWGTGLRGLLVGETAAFAVLVLIQGILYWKKYALPNKGVRGGPFPFRRLLRYGGFCYFNEFGEQILDVETDFFIITAFLGSHMVGLYAFATETIKMISRWMPHRLLMDVITPAFYTRYSKKGDAQELGRLFNLITKLILFFFLPVAAGLFVLGDKLITYIYDPKYLEALGLLWIVTAFSLVNSFNYPLGLVVESIERVEIHLYSKIFSVYNLIGDILVVRRFGVTGVALVTGSAVFLKMLFTIFFARKYVFFSMDWKAVLRISLNAAGTGLAVYFMKPLITNLWTFLAVLACGGLLFLVFSFLNPSFSRDEQDMINRVISRPVFRF